MSGRNRVPIARAIAPGRENLLRAEASTQVDTRADNAKAAGITRSNNSPADMFVLRLTLASRRSATKKHKRHKDSAISFALLCGEAHYLVGPRFPPIVKIVTELERPSPERRPAITTMISP